MATITSRNELRAICEELRKANKIVGFTSGAFDILHAGHVVYLKKAREQCDVLIVALNSDSSIKQYKSKDRPVNPEQDRLKVIASLAAVDYVFLFDEPNNNKNVEELKPQVYFKAEDYQNKPLTSKPIVESYGGKVVLVPMLEGRSTTALIEKIAQPANSSAQQVEVVTYPKSPAVFVDRDGTIIEHVEYLHEPEKLKFIPGALDALLELKQAGFRIVVVTNQPGIGLGYFTKEDFFVVNRQFLRQAFNKGLQIDRVYFCPHNQADSCSCRKPATGMIDRARGELNIDLLSSFVVGDTSIDVKLGENAGCKTVLVETGLAGKDGTFKVTPSYVAKDLGAAKEWILKNRSMPIEAIESALQTEHQFSPSDTITTLEGIGRVTGKMGHDFNNLLGSIRGCADLIRSKLGKLHPDGVPVAKQLQIIDSAVEKGEAITAKMRSFLRPGPLDTSRTSIHPCIEEVSESIKKTYGQRVDIATNIACNPPLNINEFQIEQILLAACTNAIEAMSKQEQACIVLTLEEIELSGKEIESLEPGKYARLCLIDHGVGLSDKSKEKLFKPFFSTSPGGIGKGLGLSLSMAREIMRRHRGAISVNSIKDCGTTVQLYFPIPA